MWSTLSRRLGGTMIPSKGGKLTRTSNLLVVAPLSTSAASANNNSSAEVVQVLRLNMLQDNPGAVKKKRRVGRGVGSSKGKTCGRGHKGQKARSGGKIHPTFEGGPTKLYKLFPKRGFNNKRHATEMYPLNIGTLQTYIDMGRLDAAKPITMRELQLAGMFKANKIKHGIKLLADGKERLKQPIEIYVSRASSAAIEAMEDAGGSGSTVHYNRLALRQLLRPEKFVDRPVRQARPPPKWQSYYTSWKKRGYLNPAIQMREWLSGKPELDAKFKEILDKQEKRESVS